MKKLMEQILKFGVVGVICFGIDFVITLGISAVLRGMGKETSTAALIGAFFGFMVSVIVNYLLSMNMSCAQGEHGAARPALCHHRRGGLCPD